LIAKQDAGEIEPNCEYAEDEVTVEEMH